MEWLTTSTILRDLRAFEHGGAWDGFVERFRRPIISFARKLGHSPQDSEDVAQETLATFAQAYRDGRYDRERGRLSQWLFGIAYRHALKERERSARRETAAGSSGDPHSFWKTVPAREEATKVWDREWEQAILESCLAHARNEVEPATFHAFEMAVFQDRPAADIAETLGISVTAVYNAKHRVIKRLRELRARYEQEEP